jgi:hypothetical protein
MAARELHARDATHVQQVRTQTLRVVVAVDAERRGYGKPLNLRTHR